ICEELNIKQVSLHDPEWGALLVPVVRLNMKTVGPKFGPRLKTVQAALTEADATAVAAQVQAGEQVELACSDGPATLDPADLVVQLKPPDGWAGVADRGTQVLIDVRITEALAREGMAREVVRYVQDLRKKSGLEMEDRIVLSLQTKSDVLAQAI